MQFNNIANANAAGILDQVQQAATTTLSNFAAQPNALQKMQQIFGGSIDKEITQKLLTQFQKQDFSDLPVVEILSPRQLSGANGAFSSETNTIYLSSALVRSAVKSGDITGMTNVLLEEVGHKIDAKINKVDTTGDEGEAFSMLARGIPITPAIGERLKLEDDRVVALIGGKSVLLELNASVAAFRGVVDGTLNVRTGPGTNHAQVSTLALGSNVTFDAVARGTSHFDAREQRNDDRWYRIQGTNRWVSAAFITGNPLFTGTVDETLNVRTGPGTNHQRIDSLTSGSRVTFDATTVGSTSHWDTREGRQENRWFRIQGTDRWVSAAFITGNPDYGVPSPPAPIPVPTPTPTPPVQPTNPRPTPTPIPTPTPPGNNFSPQPIDNAGNTLSGARGLGTLSANSRGRYQFAANDFVNTFDRNDYYRFTLNNRSNLNFTISNMSADADLELIQDRNNNGMVDSGEVIRRSSQPSLTTDSVSETLNAGTYFVRVYQGISTASTNYSLRLVADLNWGTIEGRNLFGGTLRHEVGLERVNGSSQAIDSSKATWLVIHGMDGNPSDLGSQGSPNTIRLLGRAIDGFTSNDQVFFLDWRSAAKSNVLAPIGASWITTVAGWAAQKLNALGIPTANLNLVGHSLGAYVAAETARGVTGGVNRLVALDPAAKHLLLSYNADSVDFKAHSWRSWGFYGSSLGDSARTATADEAFTIGFGNNWFLENHGRVVNLFASMVEQSYTNPGNRISQLFGLNRLFNDSKGPWRSNEFNDFGLRGVGIGSFEGRLEGREEWQWDSKDGRWVSRWVPKSFRYKNDSDPLWEIRLTEINV